MKKIAVVISARPSYSRVKSFLSALKQSEEFDCVIALTQSAVLRNFGDLPDLLARDGFGSVMTFHNSLAENTPLTMALNTASSLQDVAKWLAVECPDACVVIADRYETLSISIAASYQNIPLIHIQGGEVTGNIDEKVRHANTKLADIHLVSNEFARKRVLQMGEAPERVAVTGCPSLDIIDKSLLSPLKMDSLIKKYGGVGGLPDLNRPYTVVLLHPETESQHRAREQVDCVYQGLKSRTDNIIWFWPNVDAGSDTVSKYLREVVNQESPLRFFRSFDPADYLSLIYHSAVLIGNSSSGIREAGFLGIPTVNIGTRQDMRERGPNVLDVDFESRAISEAVALQMAHGPYESSNLYGEGDAGQKMVAYLAAQSWPLVSWKRFKDG